MAPDPQDGDVKRGRVQSGTTGGEASQHHQQQQPQHQQQPEKDEKSQQVWRNGQQHHVQRGDGVVTGMEAGGCRHWDGAGFPPFSPD